MAKYNICVVCGSGMATSVLISQQLKDLLKQRNIDANITTTKVSDLGAVSHYNVIVTSTLLPNNLDVPVIRTMSFLTGLGMDKDVDKIVNILQGNK
ncbi:MAG: PTS sugar transporter subunit IIB [Lutispora sp.]|nr:PTS sugar transporter subunit IIB [Lutispora sp.]